jgi:hypothetical protein
MRNLAMYYIITGFLQKVNLLAVANEGSEASKSGSQMFEQTFYGNEL